MTWSVQKSRVDFMSPGMWICPTRWYPWLSTKRLSGKKNSRKSSSILLSQTWPCTGWTTWKEHSRVLETLWNPMASSWLHHSEVTHSRSSEFASIWPSPSATAASARVSHQCFLSQLWETCSLGAATLCQRLISQGRHASSPLATLCSITCKVLASKVPCTKDRGPSQRTPSLL